MANNIWFKRKKYGWGWTPASKEGWLVVLIYLVVLAIYPLLAELGVLSFEPAIFGVIFLFATVPLIAISYKKGEPPSWRWGE